MVMVPNCCKAMRSMQLSTFGAELWLAHRHSAWHVWIMVIPVCADMGRHVFMVFWRCRWPLPHAHLLFVLLEVRTWFLFGLQNPQKNCRHLKMRCCDPVRVFREMVAQPSFAGDSKVHIEKPETALQHKIVQLHWVLGATVKSILHMSLCINQWIHVGCLHIHDSQKKLHRTACDSPRNEVYWWLRSGCLQVWYPRSRFVRSTCSVVRPKTRTFAVESLVC